MAKKKASTTKPSISVNHITIDNLTYWSVRVILSIMILYVAHNLATNISKYIVIELKKNVSIHKKLIIYQLSEIIFYVIFGMGILIALINIGVQTTTILTLMGTMAITVGLALQGILSNIFSGIYVALTDNFRIGDVIRIYVPFIPPIEGKVKDLNITYAVLQEIKTNQIIYIPNTSISGNVIINLSKTNNKEI